MPLSDDIRSGLSTGSRAFREGDRLSLPRYRSSTPPQELIDGKIFDRTSVTRLTFPPDQPRIHFIIIENDWGGTVVKSTMEGKGSLTPQALIRLPLPTPLEDAFNVNFDANFNYLRWAQGADDTDIARIPQSILGAEVNKYKTVTLENPDFRAFQMNWKLSPKTFQESQEIQRIVYRLRKGMTPKLEGAREFGVFVFPQIYTLAFVPNVQYMYKFKPCVLQSLSVDYSGGQPVPSFYKSQGSNGDSPPESIEIKTRWLEVEYWVKSDYKGSDLPSTNPFDAIRRYDIVTEGGD